MLQYEVLTGDDARRGEELSALCRVAFDGFDPNYLTDRLPHIVDPLLNAARFADGSMAGFKLGYRRGGTLFYSWLGGVHPNCRRQGIARELSLRQHGLARSRGYEFIETRTRAGNAAMLILNISLGFRICGFETDRGGQEIVTFRKKLVES
jgi:ribosomal protein S18 acetylase RimI-like enzyme